MKKSIIFLAVFTLLIFGCGQEPNEPETSQWQIYENSRYGFSVEYPADWSLGEAPANNDGRNFTSPDEAIQCQAYGWHNALINEEGEPQTLDEYIAWTKELDPQAEVLEDLEATLDGQSAVSLVTKNETGVAVAVYALGTESGRALACYFNDVEFKDNFTSNFQHMVESFQIEGSLD